MKTPTRDCRICGGEGWLDEHPRCPGCNGSGKEEWTKPNRTRLGLALDKLEPEVYGATMEIGTRVVRRLNNGWLVDQPRRGEREFCKTLDEVLDRVMLDWEVTA